MVPENGSLGTKVIAFEKACHPFVLLARMTGFDWLMH